MIKRILFAILATCFLLGCTPNEPPPIPTLVPTPATAEERHDAYWEKLQLHLASLKRDVLDIDNARSSKNESFLIGLSVGLDMSEIAEMSIPTDEDLQSLGYAPGLLHDHESLVSILRPCGNLGTLAMSIETVSLEEFLLSQEVCKKTITDLEAENETYKELFQCPNNHPSCK